MRKTKAIMILAAAGGVSLWAQQHATFEYRTVGPLETKAVTGAPYSATATNTLTQTLGDGTHIRHTTTAQIARDSQGRTRREETISALGPWSTGGNEQHLITINDPVAQAHYILHPDQQMAMKGSLPFVEPLGIGAASGIAIGGIKGAAVIEQTRTKVMASPGDNIEHTKMLPPPGDNVMFVAREGTMMVMSGSEGKAQMEDLGDQVIEGVRAHGRREKRTIAVGEIGNDRPIEVLSETWYSDELQTMVLSKRSDPRVGDSEYRLANISRAEPAGTLFEVPAGYTVKEGAGYMIKEERRTR